MMSNQKRLEKYLIGEDGYLRKEISNEWFAILNGVITLIFGLAVLTNIVAGASALVMVFGIFAIISGILMIVLSFKVKGLKKA